MADDGIVYGPVGHDMHRDEDPDAGVGADRDSWECDELRGGSAFSPPSCASSRAAVGGVEAGDGDRPQMLNLN